jgi:signal transduction histidine kinase
MNNLPILSLEVGFEEDVVLARQRARQVAALLGFDPPEQTRIATSTSEIARNAVQHAGRGRVEFLVDSRTDPPMLVTRVRDHGPGIGDVQAVLDGRAAAPNGSARGVQAARRLMDRFEIDSTPARGTVVMMAKALPLRTAPPTPESIARLADELARIAPRQLVEEVRQQDRELLRALNELRDRQAELSQINRELEETNRGVVALYAELDEKASSLLRVSELKTRFLSNMSHEFRSPLNSIVRLAGFLLDRTEGELSAEQEKQVVLIRKSAMVLSEMVNDLLDLAKVEAGKVVVRPETFEAADLFRTLRGMIRPLLTTEAVALVFDEPTAIRPLRTDEGKLAQVLRNFLSNAIKFTEAGEIRVGAQAGPGDSVVFSVSDTGIGIAEQDQARIFEEFGQVESPIQTRVKGTGLGLPLSRRLAELLGGSVSVRSAPGQGSTFTATIPRLYRDEGETAVPRSSPATTGRGGSDG